MHEKICPVNTQSENICFLFPGGNKVIDVIDVARQADSKLKLGEFVKYYYQPERPKVLNVISLEFSDTKYVCVKNFTANEFILLVNIT